jgi:alkaline phosphatase
VHSSLDAAITSNKAPLAIFTADVHNTTYPERGNMLPKATQKAIDVLKQDKDGFFLMVEGSQIDWGGHANSTPYIVQELLDLDIAIGLALEFAAKNGETLVIVTADHETGGMTINGGNIETGSVSAHYTTKDHSAVMVPVFAYGPRADEFMGIYKNIEVFKKIKKVFGF